MIDEPNPRFEETHGDLPVGTVCHTDFRGDHIPYIFAGWKANTAGKMAIFVRVCRGETVHDGWLLSDVGFVYRATFTRTILRKFPDLPGGELSRNCPVWERVD